MGVGLNALAANPEGGRARLIALRWALADHPQVECPLVHRFTPGLYVRQIFMPRGTLVVSKRHRTEHPFVISAGRVSVWQPGGPVVHLAAPHCGITAPGTQRLLYIHEDCTWTTFHPTTETDVAKLEALLVEDPTLELAGAPLAELKQGA